MCKLEVTSLGYGCVEAVPLFHVAPGGAVMRVLVPAMASFDVKCPEWCGVLKDLTEAAGSEEPIDVDIGDVIDLALRWRVDVIVLEGLEPSLCRCASQLLEAASRAGLLTAIRTQGLGDVSVLGKADAIVFDYLAVLAAEARYKISALSLLENLAKLDALVELNLYMDEPLPESVTPILHRLRWKDPLHLHIGNPRGGGPARLVYETSRKSHSYTYLHSPPYDRLDTYCHKCGALVAVREYPRLVSLHAPGGRCWRCGAKLPFLGPLYDRTKPTVLRRCGGGARWHDPRIVVMRNFSNGPM
jgi:hypothetical protein